LASSAKATEQVEVFTSTQGRRWPFALAAFLICLVGSAHAQTIPELVLEERYNEARAALAERNASALDRAFTEVLIARRQGDTPGAIARLRNILRARPDLVPVRRLLANLLAETGQYEAAEFHFRRLIEDDPVAANRAGYTRALRRIAALKPFGLSASFAFVPSTNINRGTASDIFRSDFGDFIIDEDSQGATGIGFAFSAGAFRRFELEGGNRLRLDASTSAILHGAPEYNQHSFTLRATLSREDSGEGWAIAPEYSRVYLAGALNHTRYGVALARAVQLDDDTALRLGVTAEHRDYPTDTFLTGQRYEAEATLRRRLDPRTALSGSVAYKLGEPEAARFQYNGIEVGAELTRVFESGVQLGLGLSHEWRPYRGDFTGVSFPRNDNITTLDASVFNDRWTVRGAAPTVTCSLTFAQSNIAFYDYDVQECTIGFTRAF